MRKILVFFITCYQKTLSPDHGLFKSRYPYGFCRHYPSCSEYTKQAIMKYGSLKGVYLGTRRIIKCNPWAQPSVDLVK
jgi:putative membrane protein insertion efficiency factor